MLCAQFAGPGWVQGGGDKTKEGLAHLSGRPPLDSRRLSLRSSPRSSASSASYMSYSSIVTPDLLSLVCLRWGPAQTVGVVARSSGSGGSRPGADLAMLASPSGCGAPGRPLGGLPRSSCGLLMLGIGAEFKGTGILVLRPRFPRQDRGNARLPVNDFRGRITETRETRRRTRRGTNQRASEVKRETRERTRGP